MLRRNEYYKRMNIKDIKYYYNILKYKEILKYKILLKYEKYVCIYLFIACDGVKLNQAAAFLAASNAIFHICET